MLVAEEADDVIWVAGCGLEYEACFGELAHVELVEVDKGSGREERHTLEGESFLCGQVKAFGARELAVDVRRLEIGCGPLKEARRLS